MPSPALGKYSTTWFTVTLVSGPATARICGSPSAPCHREDVLGVCFMRGNTMKNKVLAVQTVLEMTESRAKGCQLSGHSCLGVGALMRKTLLLLCVLGTTFASGEQPDQ